jgi:hypothetical protein
MYIERDISDELDLLDRIKDETETLVDVLNGLDVPNATIQRAMRICQSLKVLEYMLKQSNTYIEILDNDTGEVEKKYFSEGDYGLFYEASKHYAFSDLDHTYSINKIVFEGREVEYFGWDFGMHFVYKYKDTKEVAFENWYPQFDH